MVAAILFSLARDEDWLLDVQLEDTHLEGCGVPMPHQVSDQATGLVDGLGSLPVADPCCLDHSGIIAHVVYATDEAVVVDLELNAKG